MKHRPNSIGAKLDALLPAWTSFDVIFHELWREPEGGWSVNDSWKAGRNLDRDEAITLIMHRWEIFKLNYLARARVRDLCDAGDSDGDCLLEVDCTAFATVQNGGAE